jgi:hypothetical protein
VQAKPAEKSVGANNLVIRAQGRFRHCVFEKTIKAAWEPHRHFFVLDYSLGR